MHFANIKISAINNRERLLFIISLGCKDSYGRNSIHEESMICAGEEGKDTCYGDSGGRAFSITLSSRLHSILHFKVHY